MDYQIVWILKKYEPYRIPVMSFRNPDDKYDMGYMSFCHRHHLGMLHLYSHPLVPLPERISGPSEADKLITTMTMDQYMYKSGTVWHQQISMNYQIGNVILSSHFLC